MNLGRLRTRRGWFTVWAALLVLVFGVALFGLTSLVLAWFMDLEGVAGPVTELGYGALYGIVLTGGVLVQLRAPEHKIAGVQQAALVIPALLVGSALARDGQNLVLVLNLVPTLVALLALHPARDEFLRRGPSVSRPLLTRLERPEDPKVHPASSAADRNTVVPNCTARLVTGLLPPRRPLLVVWSKGSQKGDPHDRRRNWQ